jgi:hypothetical protein
MSAAQTCHSFLPPFYFPFTIHFLDKMLIFLLMHHLFLKSKLLYKSKLVTLLYLR